MPPNVSYIIVRLVRIIFDVINILIIARVLLSWFPPRANSPLIAAVYRLSDTLLAPFRRFLPASAAGLDFTPLIALLFYQFLRRILVELLI